MPGAQLRAIVFGALCACDRLAAFAQGSECGLYCAKTIKNTRQWVGLRRHTQGITVHGVHLIHRPSTQRLPRRRALQQTNLELFGSASRSVAWHASYVYRASTRMDGLPMI